MLKEATIYGHNTLSDLDSSIEKPSSTTSQRVTKDSDIFKPSTDGVNFRTLSWVQACIILIKVRVSSLAPLII